MSRQSLKYIPFFRRSGGWILTMGLVYLVFISALGLMQRSLMYFPDPARFVPSEWALKELEPFDNKTEDGLSITSWYKPARAWNKFTVVFFQGNAGHLGYRNYKVRPWLDAGYGVLMVGYRGFGNPGSPSEEGLYKDARAALNGLITKGVGEPEMVFYGESLGTGVATQMATERKESALILESPYTSIPDVGADRYPLVPVHILLRDKYNSLAKIQSIGSPLLILHGEQDRVVPVKFGRKLYDTALPPKQVEYVPEAGHNDVYNLHIQNVVLSFIGGLPTDVFLKPR